MNRKDVFFGLVIALLIAVFSFIASTSPDGLERVAEDKGFIENAASFIKSPAPDYLLPGIPNEKVAGSLAGVIGVLIVFVSGYSIARLLNKKNET